MSGRREAIQAARWRKAVCVILAASICAVVFGSQRLLIANDPDTAPETATDSTAIYQSAMTGNPDPLMRDAGLRQASSSSLDSANPLREAFVCADEVWLAEGLPLAGALFAGEATAVFSRMSLSLQEQGWQAVPSGSTAVGTFVDADDPSRWLFLSCAQEGDAVCAVALWVGLGGDAA